MSSSLRSSRVRTLIVNGEAGTRAQLHRLCANRPDLQVIAVDQAILSFTAKF